MNPSFKLLLVLIIALEVSFTRHLTINLVLVAVAIIYLLTKAHSAPLVWLAVFNAVISSSRGIYHDCLVQSRP